MRSTLSTATAALTIAAVTLLAACPDALAQATRPAAGRVVRGVAIISIDGLRPDVLLRADAPTLRGLMRRGSYSMWARTTPQSITLPSHVSMLTGVNPDAHGIQWNGDLPLAEPVYPSSPTLFDLAHRAGLATAIVSGKRKLATLLVPGTVDAHWITNEGGDEDDVVTAKAVELIGLARPDVLFVHLPSVDKVGHDKGWGSAEQLRAVAAADACVGRVLAALEETGKLRDMLVIVTADHGGSGRTHGPDDVRSRAIPWIAVGPGVRADFDLTLLGADHDVQTYDTFATACHALGLRVRHRIEGRPVRAIFQSAELVQPAAAD